MQISDLRTVSSGKHLKFKVDNIDAIGFGMGDKISLLKSGQLVDLVYNLELDVYSGFEKVQLKVKDIKIK